jgi:MSHA biogenesis protein MshK
MKPFHSVHLAAALLSMTAIANSAEQLADPTRPADARTVVTATAAQSVKVEAIMNSNGRRLAIVNGKLVRAGDSVGNARIDEILGDGVRFTRDGRSQTAHVSTQMIPVRRNVTGDRS